jgi:ubiquitin-protein ligase E3 A
MPVPGAEAAVTEPAASASPSAGEPSLEARGPPPPSPLSPLLPTARANDRSAVPLPIPDLLSRDVSTLSTGSDYSFAVHTGYRLPRERTLAVLTLKRIQGIIEAYNMPALQREIETVFRSFSCLNASFPSATVRSVSASDPGLDLSDLREAYRAMVQGAPKILHWLGTSTSRLINAMPQMKHDQPEMLRYVLILMENPLMLMTSQYNGVIQKFSAALLGLPPSSINVLKGWWRKMIPDHFARSMAVFEGLVTFFATNDIEPAYIAPVSCLQHLYSVNQQEKHVPASRFYNAELSKRLNLEEDYHRCQSGPNVFSFCRYPFLLDPDAKSRLMKIDAVNDMRQQIAHSWLNNPGSSPILLLVVKRDRLMESTLNSLASQPESIRKPLRVVFEGEQGLDEGGVTKEFFQVITRELFDERYGIFRTIPETGMHWFSPSCLESPSHLELFGVIIGLAVHNGVFLDVGFPLVVYKKLLNRPLTLQDLAETDPPVGQSMAKLLEERGNIEDLGLYFEAHYDSFGSIVSVPLCKDGSNVPVTKANRKEFVDAYVKWALDTSVARTYEPFARGFLRVCGSPLFFQILEPEELELLLCGTHELDFHELETSTVYKEGYTAQTPVLRWFWEVVHGWTNEQRKALLAFATGLVRAPIKGLKALNFCIQRAGPDSDSLPASHTCFNILDLPEYSSKEKLRNKLELAIGYAEGFGLR